MLLLLLVICGVVIHPLHEFGAICCTSHQIRTMTVDHGMARFGTTSTHQATCLTKLVRQAACLTKSIILKFIALNLAIADNPSHEFDVMCNKSHQIHAIDRSPTPLITHNNNNNVINTT